MVVEMKINVGEDFIKKALRCELLGKEDIDKGVHHCVRKVVYDYVFENAEYDDIPLSLEGDIEIHSGVG